MADAYFKQIQEGISKDGPALVKKTKAIFQVCVVSLHELLRAYWERKVESL